MEHRNISLFRGYSDTESVETSLEEIVNIIKCDAALRDRTEKHRYYLQQDLRRDADREKSGCPCFAVAVCFEGGKTREHICAWTGYTLVDLDHIAPERMAATLTLICADKYTLMAYTTISGHGIRIICRIDDLNGAEREKPSGNTPSISIKSTTTIPVWWASKATGSARMLPVSVDWLPTLMYITIPVPLLLFCKIVRLLPNRRIALPKLCRQSATNVWRRW